MIQLTNVTKIHDKLGSGIQEVSLDLKKGSVTCILGPSGSGKSTILRTIAGIESIDSGDIAIEKNTNVGFVSQDFALWPHCTVYQNIILAPSIQKNKNCQKEAEELLTKFDLIQYRDKYPTQLSGGQKQRVALLRSLLVQPDVLLLDEITSALDPNLAKSVLDLIRSLAKEGRTMVIATHHLSFAMAVSDDIAFIEKGKVITHEPATEFFTSPKTPSIASFLEELAKKDDSIQVFKGKEQYQAFHMNVIRTLPKGSTIHVAGSVGDRWHELLGDLYPIYEKTRIEKNIKWKMVSYEKGANDKRLEKLWPKLTNIRVLPAAKVNPANYNVYHDTVVTQVFDDEPTIIEIKNKEVATSYLHFFNELWEGGL